MSDDQDAVQPQDAVQESTTKALKAPKAPKAPRVLKRGIGAVVKEAILNGKTNEEALAAAKAEFPGANTTASTVSWYRNNLRNDPKTTVNIPTARELKKIAAADDVADVADVAGTEDALIN